MRTNQIYESSTIALAHAQYSISMLDLETTFSLLEE